MSVKKGRPVEKLNKNMFEFYMNAVLNDEITLTEAAKRLGTSTSTLTRRMSQCVRPDLFGELRDDLFLDEPVKAADLPRME